MPEITERLDTEIAEEDVVDQDSLEELHTFETQHLRLDEPVRVMVGDTVGLNVFVEAQYFVAIDVDAEMRNFPKELEDAVPEDTEETIRHDEGAVFISNEDGDVGPGVNAVEEGTIEEAIEQFEEDKLAE